MVGAHQTDRPGESQPPLSLFYRFGGHTFGIEIAQNPLAKNTKIVKGFPISKMIWPMSILKAMIS